MPYICNHDVLSFSYEQTHDSIAKILLHSHTERVRGLGAFPGQHARARNDVTTV